MDTIAKVQEVSKIYQVGDTTITALETSSLEVRKGEVLLIIGPSGSGKTTLLSLLGCVLYPTKGKILINKQSTSELSDNELAALRLKHIGFVFQSFNLISPLSAEENVAFPLLLKKSFSRSESMKMAHEALKKVGMFERRKNLPRQLSGGQQQRVAIARALVTDPEMLLCDEPTASLDARSVAKVMTELQLLAGQGKAVVIVTHDHRLEAYANRIIEVESGRIKIIK